MLGLAGAVILGSVSRGTHEHILLSQIRDSPTWRARPRLVRLRWRYSILPPHGIRMNPQTIQTEALMTCVWPNRTEVTASVQFLAAAGLRQCAWQENLASCPHFLQVTSSECVYDWGG
jgi:hypothetical protein